MPEVIPDWAAETAPEWAVPQIDPTRNQIPPRESTTAGGPKLRVNFDEDFRGPGQTIADALSEAYGIGSGDPGESLLGIRPEGVPSGAEITAKTGVPEWVTSPVSAAGKVVAGVGQFLTSLEGSKQSFIAALPGVGLLQRAKWIYDMAGGGGEVAGDLSVKLEKAYQDPQNITAEDLQGINEAAANTALMLYGSGKLTSHEAAKLTGVPEPVIGKTTGQQQTIRALVRQLREDPTLVETPEWAQPEPQVQSGASPARPAGMMFSPVLRRSESARLDAAPSERQVPRGPEISPVPEQTTLTPKPATPPSEANPDITASLPAAGDSLFPAEPPPATTAFDPAHIPTVEFPLKDLQLSKDVPNFKGGASEETAQPPQLPAKVSVPKMKFVKGRNVWQFKFGNELKQEFPSGSVPDEVAARYIREAKPTRDEAFNLIYRGTKDKGKLSTNYELAAYNQFRPIFDAALEDGVYSVERAEIATEKIKENEVLGWLESNGVSPEDLRPSLPWDSNYTLLGRDVHPRPFDPANVIFRGEESPPQIKSISETARGDISRISASIYPVVRVELDNGSQFDFSIRISDHGQVSANAPRHYEYDYRGRSFEGVKGQIHSDAQELADKIWQEQKVVFENADASPKAGAAGIKTSLETQSQRPEGQADKSNMSAGRTEAGSALTEKTPPQPAKPVNPELLPAAETPFNLAGEPQKFVPPTAETTAHGNETLTQHDLFAIAEVTKEVDPFKSANAAERMYGGAKPAIAKLQNQLRVMDSDPAVKRSFTKEQRARLAEVLNVLNERAGKGGHGGGVEGSPPQLGPGGELGDSGGVKPPPAEDRSFSAFAAAPMEMPEAVRVIKALTGVYPKVRERLGRYAGVFRHTDGEGGKGRVEILASQFDLLTPEEKAKLKLDAEDYAKAAAEPGDNAAKIAEERYQFLLDQAYEEAKRRNPIGAMKTIWHEIGHVVDWLPDHIIRGRGNLFGRIASLKSYFKHTLPFDPTLPEGKPITPADKVKLTREAERQLREELGPIAEIVRTIVVEEPEWKITGITPADVQNILRESAGKETPELTRWFAEQDSKVKAEVLRKAMRGLLDERLAAMGKKEQIGTRRTEKTVREKVGREPMPSEIKARFAELLAKEIKARNLADLATVKAELGGLIAWWRGTATIPDYFKTSSEMYADAFSVWANNPAAAAARAPKYSELLWNYLERKPEVKAVYDEIQRQIKSGEIMGERVRSLHEMWDNDDARSLAHGAENQQTSRRDFYDNVVYHFDRRFGPIYKSAHGYAREGALKEAIGTYLYKATEHERYLAAINRQVGGRLVEAGLDWNHDLGEYLYHKRVIEERFNLANPLGFTPKNSLERLAEMRQNLGEDRYRKLEQAAQEYRDLYRKHVVDEVVGSKMFTPELSDVLTSRAHYATFAAIRNVADNGIQRILDTQYGTSVTPHIYKQIGNLGEIKNPATATVLKGLSLISASYRNTMKREVVEMLRQMDSANVAAAKTRWNGKAREPVVVDNHPDVGTIVYLQDGKPQAFYVRRVVADAVNAASPTENHLFSSMVKVNGWMKGLFTQLNYAFWPVNMVRDTAGTVMQLPGAVLPTYLKNLPTALKAARDSVTHAKPNLAADEALRRKLVISQADPRGVWAAADNEFELKVASFGMDPAQWSAQGDKVHPIVKAWNYYRELGQTIERVNKISGMLYLDEKFPNMPEWKKREIVRERSGSPNFLERGASNPAVDMLFLFYNPWKEGVRSVAKAARENPWSFGAKATAAVLMPTVLQSAAVNGYLGDERKRQYRSIPDYDLTNYLCVPLGWVDAKSGKIAYLRLPLWEPARIAHGTLFQTLTDRGAGIASNAGGQLPGLNPIWQVGLAWSEYAMGKNPVDLSRAVNVMPKTTFEAGGLPALAEVAKYSWNSLGGSILYRFKNLNLESAPETASEKFMNLPVVNNALGRWVKISDRGLADADRAITGPIEQKRAQLRLAVRPIADKLLKQETLTASERMVLREPYAQQYLRTILPDLQKARASQQFRRLNDAPSAQSKAAIAQEMNK